MGGYYNSFVVRVWSDGQGQLRGHIEHVLTQDSSTFSDPAAVVEFIRTHLAPPPSYIPDPAKERLDENETPEKGGSLD
jgi:hypothetical protein